MTMIFTGFLPRAFDVLTPKLTYCQKPKRHTSAGWKQSAAGQGEAESTYTRWVWDRKDFSGVSTQTTYWRCSPE